MKRVMIESPFKATTKKDKITYYDYLRDCVKDSLDRGEAPFASHGFYTLFLNDDVPEERRQGMTAGNKWAAKADLIAFYLDHGMSEGMMEAFNKAMVRKQIMVFRSLIHHYNIVL